MLLLLKECLVNTPQQNTIHTQKNTTKRLNVKGKYYRTKSKRKSHGSVYVVSSWRSGVASFEASH